MKTFNSYSKLLVILFSVFVLSCNKENPTKDLLIKKWKVTELDLSGTRLSGDQVNMQYEFDKDGTFFRTEDGKTEDGTWTISEDGKKLTLNFNDQDLVAEKAIEKLTKDELVISGEEFSMQRTMTMKPVK